MSKTMKYLSWGSSDVDWCENNFEITHFIAEFWNTVSNILFFVLPPLLMCLFQQYGKRVTCGVHLVWTLLMVVGLGSVYFHTTLSLVGQLVDEIAIIWVIITALALWTPKRYLPTYCSKNRKEFHKLMLLFAVLSTGLACIRPEVNCMLLFIFGVPSTVFLVEELKRCRSNSVYNLGVRCLIMWIVALASWVSDKFLCNMWAYIQFPYLHCSWHICIALASYQACVLMAYFDALTVVPHLLPVIEYWPSKSYGIMGIPYVSFENAVENVVYKEC